MTDHARGRSLAAAALDFELLPAERAELDDHLRACPSCRAFAAGLRADARRLGALDFGLTPDRVRGRVAAAANPGIATRPSYLLLFAGAVLLILATFGAAIGVGSLLDRDRDRGLDRGGTDLAIAGGNRVHWETNVVELIADDFWIGLPGQQVVGAGAFEVHSDPGSLTYWTLEVTWTEHAREQRLFMYFAADATRWWVTEIRTYDNGIPDPDWLWYRPGDIGGPLDAAWTGTIDLQSFESSQPGRGPGRLHLANVRLVTRPGNGAPAQPVPPPPQPVAVDPARPVDAAIRPVSLANPGDAANAVESCRVRELAGNVAGMGRLARASDASRFVAWDVSDDRPAWLVEFRGRVTFGDQEFESGACLVFDDGTTTMPLALDPSIKPTLALPPLEP